MNSSKRIADTVLDVTVAATATMTASFSVLAMARPSALSRIEDSEGQRYYAQMYAARELTLAAAVVATVVSRRSNPTVFLVASGVQMADSLIGFVRGNTRQGIAPIATAAVHLVRASR